MAERARCLGDDTVLALLDGELSGDARAEAEAHADHCDRCRRLVVESVHAARATASEARQVLVDPFLAPGTPVGRYLLIAPLGRGGMATVYRAYDPELQRAVALKMLSDGDADDRGHERLLREAQALARIPHRNVVRVFDVGLHGDAVFIAMELLPGVTLQHWLAEQRPSARRTLAVLVEIGRGLAAIHGAGLVHRDVKPSNVVIGDDDVPQLIDLGLARVHAAVVDDGPDAPAAGPAVTAHGRVSGTPAYMAPEHHAGDAVTPASDQFSFCVTAYEALYGTRPFAGDTLDELRRQVQSGAVRPPPPRRGVRGHVTRAILRGLAHDPARRFPSVAALVDELTPRPRWIARGVVCAALTSIVIAVAVLGRTPPPACTGDLAAVAQVWGPARRAALVHAFVTTGEARAADTAPRVAARLDGYVARWRDRSQAVCEATRAAAQPPAMLDRRTACLDRRLATMGALVTELVDHADASAIDQAVAATEALPELAPCENLTALLASDEAGPRGRLAAELDQVDSTLTTGHYDRARSRADDVLRRAEAANDRATIAAARYRIGRLHALSGDAISAQRALEAAVAAAVLVKDDDLIARCWIELVAVRGVDQAHRDIGLALGQAADVAIVRAGEPWRLRAQLDNNLGILANSQGAFADGRDWHRRALALFDRELGPDATATAMALDNLGNALDGLRERDEARTVHERALAIRRRALGAAHPDVAASLSNLANTLRGLGDHAQALVRLDEALAIARASLGEHHMGVAVVLASMAQVLHALARYPEARQRYSEAMDVATAALRPGHPMIAECRAGRGKSALAAGDLIAARADLEAAVAAMAGADLDPRSIAEAEFDLACTLRRQRIEPARARTLATTARASYAAAQATDEVAEIDRWLTDR